MIPFNFSKLIPCGWLCIALVFFSCSKERKNGQTTAQASKPNILFIVSEDNGPELGCYGNTNVSTPHIDRLAKEGVKFEHAFVTYSVCSPSRATLFTGLYSHQNGQIGLATHKFSMYDSLKTLPTYLKEVGYKTGIIGKLHVNPAASFFWDYEEIKGSNFEKKNLGDYTSKALEFIEAGPDKPFFLMVNFPDAHFPLQRQVDGLPENPLDADDIDGVLPFMGLESPRLREFTANYYNSMNRLDIGVGMLMDKMAEKNLLDNTIIIYMGDHGPQFSRAKCSNYEAGLRVPLIIKNPFTPKSAGLVRKELISSVDIFPTILDIAGVKQPDGLSGKSIMPLLQADIKGEWRDYVFAGGNGSTSMFFYPRRSVRNQRYKLIQNLLYTRENPKYLFYANHLNEHFAGGVEETELENAIPRVKAAYATWKQPPEFELYDLQNDPYEFNNLIDEGDFQMVKEELIAALKNWQIETNDPLAKPEVLQRFVAEMDSVNANYPNHSYTKVKGFKWNYLKYFK
ncbi:sulfatase [Echinicola marina]|uniref:sulfatase family protein n=1 Tax=Echinicola marina TaxID=2859768 RepID=UPI001CF6891E|nr:sulfatase [Echinicola marina]UCS92061.1 sulfatase [Echinicola marina]